MIFSKDFFVKTNVYVDGPHPIEHSDQRIYGKHCYTVVREIRNIITRNKSDLTLGIFSNYDDANDCLKRIKNKD